MDRPAVLDIHNGAPLRNVFPQDEYDARLAKLRGAMAEHGIDVALFTSMHGISYYSGFLYCQFGRRYALVVDHDKAVTVTANIDGGHPWRRGAGNDNLVYTDWSRHNFFVALQRLIADGKTVGIEFDHVDLNLRAALAEAFPGAKFVDIAEPAMRLRMIKSTREIAHIAEMAEVADLGGEAARVAVAPGVAEFEVARQATRCMVDEIARRWPDSDLMDTWTWFQSGINTDGAHNPLTTRKLQTGDILSLNCFPMVAGYYVALERTMFLGDPSEAHLRHWQVNCQVHEEGLRLLRPGARCKDVANALNEIYAEHGLLQYRTFGYGHSFGVLSHYYGREAGLELREDVDTVLEPGMVVSMEPMIMIPEGKAGAGGYREHDILVITQTGNENVTKFPYGPAHNIVPA